MRELLKADALEKLKMSCPTLFALGWFKVNKQFLLQGQSLFGRVKQLSSVNVSQFEKISVSFLKNTDRVERELKDNKKGEFEPPFYIQPKKQNLQFFY